ncbi:MAG: ABC transporter permease [Acetobacteraceae bacterium]|nr:ABC transporter permease [Acetobacteraceae bacterium]
MAARDAGLTQKTTGGLESLRIVWRRLKRHRLALSGFVLFLVLVFLALFAPWIAPYPPNQTDFPRSLKPPCREHLMGTDEFGRDVLSRVIYGARMSLQVGVISVGIALVLGVFLGALSGYVGGWVDNIIMRLMDIMLAFPAILLAISIMAVLGPGLTNAMIAIGIVTVPQYARIVRGSILSIKEHEYVEAARAIGCSQGKIIFRHILPNIMAPIIVRTTLGTSEAILEAAALGFLGLGVQPPTAEWGAMLSRAQRYIYTAPYLATFPGLAITATVLGLNLFGDGLRDALDPRLKE